MFFGARLLLRIWAMARGQNSKRAKHALTPQSQSFQFSKYILKEVNGSIYGFTLTSELMTNNETHGNMFSPPIEKQHEEESCEFAVRSLHLGFGNRAGRKQLRCCAVLAAPPPPLYCNASSHFALVRLASRQCNGRPQLHCEARPGPTSREIAQSRAGPCRTRADPARRGLGSCKLATADEARHVE